MIRGIYTGATGMLTQQRRLDVISNNLANVNTAGFKRDYLASVSFPEVEMYRVAGGRSVPVGPLGYGADTPVLHTDFGPGSLQVTGNPLDLAIEGEGFFAVDTPRGERYTRAGHFFRNAQGFLVTGSGDYVLGQRGRIPLSGSEIQVSQDGWVSVDGRRVDRIRVVIFPPAFGRKEGENKWVAAEVTEVAEPRIRQGAVERANVNAVKEMVDMITVLKAYEANQKIITTQDELLDRAVNEVGRT
ncbi:MAG: flagellar hook-basal body protein [Firmicutes bacterium]|nr:flagellar hook-basal body protein [Bacillota bacterium]